jgi:hypothetical protein
MLCVMNGIMLCITSVWLIWNSKRIVKLQEHITYMEALLEYSSPDEYAVYRKHHPTE